MKRLKLEIDALTVTSFPTAPAAEARGTVQAHVASTPACPKTFDCTYEGPDCVQPGFPCGGAEDCCSLPEAPTSCVAGRCAAQ